MKCIAVGLDEIEVKLIALLRHGYTYPQMQKEVYLSESAIKKRFYNLRQFYQANNNIHLLEILREKGSEGTFIK